MPGVRLHFEFYGQVELDRTLAGLEERTQDLRPVWDTLRRRFLVTERKQFDSEGAFGGGKWAPLSPAYGAWKAAHYPGKPILVRTGELRRSLTEGPQVTVMEPHLAIFGSAVEYGQYHEEGSAHLPRRPPVQLPAAERREWVRAVQRFIVTGEA
jgi:phage gpG-like protein